MNSSKMNCKTTYTAFAHQTSHLASSHHFKPQTKLCLNLHCRAKHGTNAICDEILHDRFDLTVHYFPALLIFHQHQPLEKLQPYCPNHYYCNEECSSRPIYDYSLHQQYVTESDRICSEHKAIFLRTPQPTSAFISKAWPMPAITTTFNLSKGSAQETPALN